MSKSGVLKSGWIRLNQTNTRVIDTNALVENKLKEISNKLAAETNKDEGFTDGFMQGIDAVQVAELVGEVEDTAPIISEPAGPTSEELLAKAAEEINSMKEQAVREIEQARKKALEEGRKEGYEKGFEQGKQEGFKAGHEDGLNSVEAQKEEMLAQISEKEMLFEEEFQKKVNELEPMFIDTITGIYEHIFNVSLKNSRDLVVHLIGNTMRNIEGNSGYLVHVSKDDYPFVSMQKKELVKGTSIALEAVDIIEDATLQKCECTIETGNGVFDCSLGTQLEALNEELRLLSYERNTAE